LSKKKKAVLISLLIIAPIAVVIISAAFTPYFQPRTDQQPPMPDVAERTLLTANDSTSEQTESSSSSSNMPRTITIVSTPSAFPFVQRWAAEYENQQLASSSSGNVDVEYLADKEINAAKANDSDLAIVGIANEVDAEYIPLSPQAVAIVYNIPSFPDIPSGLRLNSTTLFHILNGSITQWNDAVIKDLNPGLNLPNEKIIVVYNSDDNDNNYSNGNDSSSMLLLNRYLGPQNITTWPSNSISASGPAELAETVRKIPYSVGYVDFSYAVQTRMTYAAIEDADGNYILPSTDSIGQAVNVALQFHNSSRDEPPSQQPSINATRLVNGSYPLVGLYYASLLTNGGEEGRNASMMDFVEWIISEGGGQKTLLEVQYPPIYPGNDKQLTRYAKIIMDTITTSD